MTTKVFLFLITLFLAISGCNSTKVETADIRLGGWDYFWMDEVKSDLKNDGSEFLSAFNQLLKEAEEALAGGVYSVTFKNLVPPGGSKNDYLSIGPYWWPDPEKPDGLPYIRRDGEVNPERDKLDSAQKSKMTNAVRNLTLAWFFSGKAEYAEKAAELLRVWFLDPETLMNPHLNYGQSIPGRTDGRFIGIIDGRSFAELVDAIALLETSGALTEEEKIGLRNWFEAYFTWLTTSEFGKEEDNYKNNHSVAYDVQACGIAYFLGKDDYVRLKVGEVPERRIDPMIEEDGRQPHELIRTKAFGYSVSNLRNFFDTGELGLRVGVDIFNYKNPKGGSLQKALDYLIGFIGREQDWPYEQISGWEQTENNLGLLVRKAAVIYKNETYQNLWKNTFSDRLKSDWRLLVDPEFQLHVLPATFRETHGGTSTVLGWDSHNSVTLGIDKEGSIHLSGNMHVNPLNYFRSNKTNDISMLEQVMQMVRTKEDRCTYPKFMNDRNGELIFHYRDGGSENGNEIYNIYNTETKTWNRLLDTPLTDGQGLMNA